MSSAQPHHIPTGNKKVRAATARIDLACTVTERFANSSRRQRTGTGTLQHANSSSSLRGLRTAAAASTNSPVLQRKGRARFGSSASFDGVLDRASSPQPANTTSAGIGSSIAGRSANVVGKSKEDLMQRQQSLPISSHSPCSLVSLDPSCSSLSAAGQPHSLSNSHLTTASTTTSITASTGAVKQPDSSLSGEDRAALFVNRLTLDLCANSSLFSDVCDTQLFQEKQQEEQATTRSNDVSSPQAPQSMNVTAAGTCAKHDKAELASSPTDAVSSPDQQGRPEQLAMKMDQGKGAGSPETPGKAPVLSPKDGMMFSYFDVPVSDPPAERRQLPLAPVSSDRSATGLFRRTLCVNTSTVSPVFDGAQKSSSSATLPSTSGVDSLDGAVTSSTSRGNSVAAGPLSATSSPAKTPRRRKGSHSSDQGLSALQHQHQHLHTPVRRTNSTRRLANFFDRVFRRRRSSGRDDDEEEEGYEANARFSGTSSSQNGDLSGEQAVMSGGVDGELETLDGAMMASCPSLSGKISLSDSLALSCTTPELNQVCQEPARKRTSFSRLRSLTGRRSVTPADRVNSPNSECQSDVVEVGRDYKRSCGTPEYGALSAIPQSPPERRDLGDFSPSSSDIRTVHVTDPRAAAAYSRSTLQGDGGKQESRSPQYSPATLKRMSASKPSVHQGTVTVLPGSHTAIHSSLVSLPSRHTTNSPNPEAMSENEHRLTRRLSGDLHGNTVNSVSPREGSPTSYRSVHGCTGAVVVRDQAQLRDHQQRLRKSRSMEEETIAAAVAEARGKMQKKEFAALSGMGLLSPDSKGRLVPKHKDWSVSMDHLEQQGSDGSPAAANHVLPRRLSSHETKPRAAQAVGPIPQPAALINDETRNMSRSLSSVLFKRKSSSLRSSIVEGVPEGQIVKGTSIDSLNSPAKSLASGTSDIPHTKHHTVTNPSDASSEYFPSYGHSPLVTTSAWFSAPPPIDFHPPNKPKSQMTDGDLRQHVVQTLLDTEQNYVGALRTLVKDYFSQLKRNNLIDPTLVDEIFFQIPVINLCHKRFNQQLRERADKWHSKSMLGDIFLQSFSKGILSHAYTAYINHFIQVKDTLRLTVMQKPAFGKFLEQVSRESDDKLTLSDLLIMPVQRIPRYVLILKDLLKHCPYDHPDHGPLLQALDALCALAEKMNRNEEQVTNLELLKELEFCFNGLVPGLVAPHRQLVRKDRVSEVIGSQSKDRLMIMLNDVLLCATVRRRTGSKKGVGHASLLSSSDTNVRYKLMWRVMVKDVSVFQSQDEIDLDVQAKQEIELLEKDLILLSDISLKCEGLASPHQELYQSINIMIKSINDGIQARKSLRELATLTMTVDNKRGHSSQHIVVFQTSEEKNSWLHDYRLTKDKLDEPMDGRESWHRGESDASSIAESAALISVSHAPRFIDTIQMMKTRSGMQITCACPSVAPSHLTPTAIAAKANGQLWVCASDGNVGQVCMVNTEKLSLRLTACITVCDSRITCIIAVPEFVAPDIQRVLAQQERSKILAEHHLSYDSESDNETSGEERSLHDAQSPNGPIGMDRAHGSESAALGSRSQQRSNVPNPSAPVALSGRKKAVHHTLSDTAILKSPEVPAHPSPLAVKASSNPSSPMKRKVGTGATPYEHGVATDDGETGDNTPVPSSPSHAAAKDGHGQGGGGSSAQLSSPEGPSVSTLRRTSAPLQPALAGLQLKTNSQGSSPSASSVVSPADEVARGELRAPVAASSPGRKRSTSAQAEEGEEVFVAAALLNRVRHFNSLAESGDSPTVARSTSTGQTCEEDLVDSGIIPGDEASASSTVSVSRSASDVSTKSNNGSIRPVVAEKARITTRSKSMSDSRTRRIGRSLSHSILPAVQPQRISAAHLITSQHTNNLAADGKRSMDHDPTMWLGTENGLLYIYRAGDSIRMRQRRTVLRFKSGVAKLCHTGSHVYVSMKDGHLIVFSRAQLSSIHSVGDWDTRDPSEVITNLPGSVVTSMAVVEGEVWCACGDRILIIGRGSSFVRKSIIVGNDASTNKISHIACLGLCVYIAMETGGVLHCYSAASQEYLFSIDTMASVAQMLTGCDTIIRQHKINCLRVTALESYRGLIWAGTSAGVVLTVQNLPTITKTTTSRDIVETPQPQASYNGHTGPVRFITATERMSKTPLAKTASDSKDRADALSRHSTSELTSSASSSVVNTPLHASSATHHHASAPDLALYAARTDVEALVITGGDGYEDFKASAMGENDDFAQDDSSSHLLIWQTT